TSEVARVPASAQMYELEALDLQPNLDGPDMPVSLAAAPHDLIRQAVAGEIEFCGRFYNEATSHVGEHQKVSVSADQHLQDHAGKICLVDGSDPWRRAPIVYWADLWVLAEQCKACWPATILPANKTADVQPKGRLGRRPKWDWDGA